MHTPACSCKRACCFRGVTWGWSATIWDAPRASPASCLTHPFGSANLRGSVGANADLCVKSSPNQTLLTC
jgi:hypothetical protein